MLYDVHIPRCTHIKTNGTQCGSPALRGRRFCFFHKNWQGQRIQLNAQPVSPLSFTMPVLEDADQDEDGEEENSEDEEYEHEEEEDKEEDRDKEDQNEEPTRDAKADDDGNSGSRSQKLLRRLEIASEPPNFDELRAGMRKVVVDAAEGMGMDVSKPPEANEKFWRDLEALSIGKN